MKKINLYLEKNENSFYSIESERRTSCNFNPDRENILISQLTGRGR